MQDMFSLEPEWNEDAPLDMDFSMDPMPNVLSFAPLNDSFESNSQVFAFTAPMNVAGSSVDEDPLDYLTDSSGEEYQHSDAKLEIEPQTTIVPSISSLRQKSSIDVCAKVKPLSGRAKSIAANASVYNQFVTVLPFLTQRPPLKNDNGLFDDLQYLIDECILHFSSAHMLACVAIVCTMMSWPQMLRITSTHRFLWTRLKLALSQKHEPQAYDVFIDRNKHHVWMVEFVNWKQDFDASTDISSDVAGLVRNVLEIPNCVTVELLRLPLLGMIDGESHSKTNMRSGKRKVRKLKVSLGNPLRTNAKTPRDVVMSCACECKIWSLLMLCLVNGKGMAPDQCYLDTFLSKPEICSVLMNMTVQSLLYYCAEHDQLLESLHRRAEHAHDTPFTNVADNRMRGSNVSCAMFDVSMIMTSERCRQFSSKLFAQTNRKSLLAVRKQGANRVGKFKGRQRDNLLCITINGTIGMQITFEALFTTSIFAHLIELQKLPCSSEINYSDLVTHLPFIFPQNFDCLFGAEFYIKTPYMQTSDPEHMFGPIAKMLWPNLSNIETLVKEHLKTYKLEFEIGATNDNTTHAVQFVRALGLGPNKPYEDWKQWVSVVDVAEHPLGMYFRGGENLRGVCAEINKRRASEQRNVTVAQLTYMPLLSLLHRVMLHSENSDIMATTTTSTINVHDPAEFMATSSTPAQYTWKGSRKKGFAVRRVFKNGHVMVHVFASLRDFIQREAKHKVPKVKLCERMFALLDTATIVHDPCSELNIMASPLISMEQLQRRMETIDVTSKLVVVDDIGRPRYYALGNKPRGDDDDAPQYTSCRSCAVLVHPEQQQQQQKEEHENAMNLQWFAALHASRTTDGFEHCELPPTQVLESAFVMSHDGVNPQLRPVSSGLSLHQHTSAVMQSSNATFRYAYVGAMYNPQLHYVNSYKEMTKILMQRALSITVAYGCKLNTTVRNNVTHFEAELPRDRCKCCNSSGNVAHTTVYCKMHIAAVLLVIDLYEPIDTITTTIEALQGHTLKSTPFQARCGLRCAHDWTNGSGDVFFRGTFARPAFNTNVLDATFSFGDEEQHLDKNTPSNVLVVDKHYGSSDAIEHGSRLLVLTHP